MDNGSSPNKEGKQLTELQADVLQFIKQCCEKTGLAPSYREIQKHFGYKAVGTVQDHVRRLKEKGFLENVSLRSKRVRKARSLIPKGYRWEQVQRIPIYGEIAAGHTREATQLELGALYVPDTLVKAPCFALRVVGDSMIEVGIYEGDYVIVERCSRVNDGNIIVALVDGETTVKRYVLSGGKAWLVPENRSLSPISLDGREFEIQGRVVGLQRTVVS